MKKYRIEIYNLNVTSQDFTRIAEIITYQNLVWMERQNGIGGCSFELDLDDPAANSVNLQRFINQIIIKEYEDDLDPLGRIVWSGPITKISGSYEGNEGSIFIEANTALYHLTSRYTDLKREFTATDQASIIWTLIDETQDETNGFLGFTQGGIVSGKPRDRLYERGRIADLIINISELNDGCSFTFDAQVDSNGLFIGWQLNTYFPTLGGLREDLNQLELGINVDSVAFNTKGEIFNTITGIGSGTGEAVITSEQVSSGSQLGSTRREDFYLNKDVSLQDTLDEQTEAALNRSAVESFEVKIVISPDKNPLYGDYICGDYLRLNLVRGYMNLQYWAKVKEITVRIDKEGAAKVEPTLTII